MLLFELIAAVFHLSSSVVVSVSLLVAGRGRGSLKTYNCVYVKADILLADVVPDAYDVWIWSIFPVVHLVTTK